MRVFSLLFLISNSRYLKKENTPFFIFKATEFNLSHINDLFNKYGEFTLIDFVQEYAQFNEKYIVIDSAEKLSDSDYPETFQEFLSTLIRHNWKIIFTTRHSYLSDLKNQFVGVYHQKFDLFNIPKLKVIELKELSKNYNFTLPKDERLLELLQIPFYLDEFLQNYRNIGENIDYSDFKNLLWNKQILNSSHRKNNIHLKREKCFLSIAKKRADTGSFFVNVDDFEDSVLQELEKDEIINYDFGNNGYFITHDIYEEWALDKIIESVFKNSANWNAFFELLGSSLPIRRAFRNWLSDKLLNNRESVKPLIENSFINEEIETFWKDEILVSVLLSDYSEVFFKMFEESLLANNQNLLMRTIFLLRIACKEIDESLLSSLGLDKNDKSNFRSAYTKPKGNGWISTIEFVHNHIKKIDISKLEQIIPLLDEWNKKNKRGLATQKASQTALYYLIETGKKDIRYRFRNSEKKIIEIILNGAVEIKDELENIFNDVISKKDKDNSNIYYELIQTVLSSALKTLPISTVLPEQIIKLADLFWHETKEEKLEKLKERYEFGYSSYDRQEIENYFCISQKHREYYPPSAYQTPIFQLLKVAPKSTIDFILTFTNKTVSCFANSEYSNQVEQVDVYIGDDEVIKQYVNPMLWGAYRGTQSAPDLLQSIYMALEKYLLDFAKTADKEVLENWCIYLIKNSISASITALVTSIVLANPSKLFNVAKIIFQTKEFFQYDTGRYLHERIPFSFSSGFNVEDRIYDEERKKTFEDRHRKMALEHLALNYQIFRDEDVSEEEGKERQEIIWKIFDNYYSELPDKTKQTEQDKVWRIYLARMDRRKMSPEYEKVDEGVLIKFNPELDLELREMSESSSNLFSESMKYMDLKWWAYFKFRGEEKYKDFHKYENDFKLAILDVKEILKGLKEKAYGYSLYYRDTPAYVCAVLLRDFFDSLNKSEKSFCRKIIIDLVFHSNKFTQFLDDDYGIEKQPVISTLPLIFNYFPKDRNKIKAFLFMALIQDSTRKDGEFVIKAIRNNLWKLYFEDAESIFLGYLLLKPKWDDLKAKLRKQHYEKFTFSDISNEEILKEFLAENESLLENIISNNVVFDDFEKIKLLDLSSLLTAFDLLQFETKNEKHKQFVKITTQIFAEKLSLTDRKNDIKFDIRNRFFTKFSYFVLNSTKNDIETYIKPFIDNFVNLEAMAELFHELIYAEDHLGKYDEFWFIWNNFYEKVIETVKVSNSFRVEKLLHNYLFANDYFVYSKEWHSLKDKDKIFFAKVVKDIGFHSSVLFGIAKFIYYAGIDFLEESIYWISDLLNHHKNLWNNELEENTIFYIENLIRKYILTNRLKIKTEIELKNRIINILNFLVEKGSVEGYLFRENIL